MQSCAQPGRETRGLDLECALEHLNASLEYILNVRDSGSALETRGGPLGRTLGVIQFLRSWFQPGRHALADRSAHRLYLLC
jgi:hypothetical protein